MKNNKNILIFSVLFVTVVPVFVQAFSLSSSNLYNVIDEINIIIRLAMPIIYSLAFIAFFWGLSRFILNSNNPAEVQKGKSYMIWGVIALFVLISVRTIVGLIAKDLGIGDTSLIPLIPTPNSNNYNNNDLGLPHGTP